MRHDKNAKALQLTQYRQRVVPSRGKERQEPLPMNDWDIVTQAFEDESEECNDCEYYCYDYCTETGADAWCELGDKTGHDPQWCLAYDRIKEELEDA
jgi:hypothetical protein